MKNKKGFTLVELLAVIVILGVLLLVAIPAVSTVITNSRKGADRDEAIEFLNAIESCTLSNGNVNVCSASETATLLKGTFTGYYDTEAECSGENPNCTYISGDEIYVKDFAFVGANGYAVHYSGTASATTLKGLINNAGNSGYGDPDANILSGSNPAVKALKALNS